MSNSVLCRLLAVACILFRGATPPGGGSRSGPLDVVGPRSRYTRYSTAGGGATTCSRSMVNGPLYMVRGAEPEAEPLDVVGSRWRSH